MTLPVAEANFSIGEVAERTGLGEGTLRMWETRYGFPHPERLPNGRRVYRLAEIEQIDAVLRGRSEGLSLSAAIERTRNLDAPPQQSVFRALRSHFPRLHPRLMKKQALLWLTRAVEDETSAQAVSPLLIGCFQEERFYRQAEHRWHLLARSAKQAIVLADFPKPSEESEALIEVPLFPADALLQEWVLVSLDESFSACVVGRESPPDSTSRGFEVVWSTEPAVVQEAARICLKLAVRSRPELEALLPFASGPTRSVGPDDLRRTLDLAARVTAYATATSER